LALRNPYRQWARRDSNPKLSLSQHLTDVNLRTRQQYS
jgi:hypothetical protein